VWRCCGIDLAQGACKPRMNVHSLYNGEIYYSWGNFLFYMKAVLWAGWQRNLPSIIGREKLSVICKAFRQPLGPTQTPICYVLRVKWLGQEANHLYLSGAQVKNVWSCRHSTSTLLYSLSVWYLMNQVDTFTIHRVFSYYCVVLCCVAHSTNCVVNNRGVDYHVKYV